MKQILIEREDGIWVPIAEATARAHEQKSDSQEPELGKALDSD